MTVDSKTDSAAHAATTPSPYTFLASNSETEASSDAAATPSAASASASSIESSDASTVPVATAGEEDVEECPCVTRLREGVCGDAFSAAYDCYTRSTAEEKGSDCVEFFRKLSQCAQENPGSFDLGSEDAEEAFSQS
ncbi:mitochondrial disulfide relay subunit Mia40 [Andalucia godoyi]|uniref:Mitochondrial disulfide relay subunit Mia40 n=1 Tax=Andalucia godoyi TaxID=505711 RepID=A0A8K0AJY6_ANDGO|nr:mitochondrial disulfide relay subunit Mia40 [Andalucia godoyi]|eukprot:ANDGO_01473.mRNA.1 mitochondrial disulfide relay subunit Mia40